MPSGDPAATRFAMLEAISDAFVAFDADFVHTYVNRRAAEILGMDPGALIGRSLFEVFPQERGGALHRIAAQAMREQRTTYLDDHRPELGKWFETRAHPTGDGVVLLFQDVTERRLAELELRRSEQRYRVLAHAFAHVVWEADAYGNPLASQSWSQLTGRGGGDQADPEWLEAIHPDDQPRVVQAWRDALATRMDFDATYRVRGADGAWRTVRARGVPVVEGDELRQWIGVIDDITERVEAEAALRRAALEDPLTGLPNRTLFLDRLGAVLRRRDRGPAAVLYVDVDRFKQVNDAFGHAGGDRLIMTVAERLSAVVRPSDVVCRLSGDEFAVLCDELEDDAEAVAIGRRLAEAVGRPMTDPPTTVSLTVGIARLAPEDSDPEAVMRAADAAMYEVKARGGAGVEVFDAALRERVRRRRAIEDELRDGLRSGALELHFQPIVLFDAQRTTTAEALLRWRAADGTTLPALEAVSVAEQTGLIMEIGAEVLRQACARAAAWNAAGRRCAVSVNLSARQLLRPDELVDQVRDALDASGLEPRLLRLELTETVLMENVGRGERLLRRLRELGPRMVIDDFGVGYSSLAYLHRLTVDAVKIDRSFVAGLPHDRASGRIVEAVVGIARAFGALTIAEGIEDERQLAAVRAAGCDGVQGYALARPVPEPELPGALARAGRAVCDSA